MKTGKFVFTLLLLFNFISVLSAQDWISDMKKMNQVYADAKSFGMTITVRVYEKQNSVKPMMTYAGKAAKADQSYYSEMMDKINIINNNYHVLVDKRQKMIIYKNVSKQKKAEKQDLALPVKLDSLVYKQSKGTYLKNDKNEKKILITNPQSVYSKMEVTIDAATNTLKQIIFYMPAKASKEEEQAEKIIVDYNDVKVNSPIADSFFSEEKYFKRTGSKTELTAAYKSYQIIDENKSIKK